MRPNHRHAIVLDAFTQEIADPWISIAVAFGPTGEQFIAVGSAAGAFKARRNARSKAQEWADHQYSIARHQLISKRSFKDAVSGVMKRRARSAKSLASPPTQSPK